MVLVKFSSFINRLADGKASTWIKFADYINLLESVSMMKLNSEQF